MRQVSIDLEIQVRARTDEFRALLVNALDAYISIDELGRIVDWNPQAKQTFGWAADEVIGKPWQLTLLPHRYRGAHRRGFEELLRTGNDMLIKAN